ncbi:hypothetical protein DTO271D3_7953 [Paecilomyces variotii]|nr:hypothetical protein DTO271D3_7953 [Paecilomyces variotii]
MARENQQWIWKDGKGGFEEFLKGLTEEERLKNFEKSVVFCSFLEPPAPGTMGPRVRIVLPRHNETPQPEDVTSPSGELSPPRASPAEDTAAAAVTQPDPVAAVIPDHVPLTGRLLARRASLRCSLGGGGEQTADNAAVDS